MVSPRFLVSGGEFAGEHLLGACRDALQRHQLDPLCVRDATGVVDISSNNPNPDLLLVEGPCKPRSGSRMLPDYRAVLMHSLPLRRPCAKYRTLRSGARRHARSSDATRRGESISCTQGDERRTEGTDGQATDLLSR